MRKLGIVLANFSFPLFAQFLFFSPCEKFHENCAFCVVFCEIRGVRANTEFVRIKGIKFAKDGENSSLNRFSKALH